VIPRSASSAQRWASSDSERVLATAARFIDFVIHVKTSVPGRLHSALERAFDDTRGEGKIDQAVFPLANPGID